MSKLQEKPSVLKRDHPAFKKMKFINFFLCLWVIFALLDPDTYLGTPLDPDPQYWLSGKGQNLRRQRNLEGHFLVTASFHLKPGTKIWMKLGTENSKIVLNRNNSKFKVFKFFFNRWSEKTLFRTWICIYLATCVDSVIISRKRWNSS